MSAQDRVLQAVIPEVKAQAARDKARDRFLSSQVGRVVRFTGSELFRDPRGCLVEAIKLLALVNGTRVE